jgi:hypothetical protein
LRRAREYDSLSKFSRVTGPSGGILKICLSKEGHLMAEQDIQEGEVYRHRRRGTVYTVIGRANLQTDRPISDDEVLVIYQGTNGEMWARPVSEFRDGRFEPVQGRAVR